MTINKDSQLPFGKNRGITPAQLSLTEEGRSYLAWGAEKLNNAAWRAAFSDALRSQPAEFDEAAVRKIAERSADPIEDPYGRSIEADVEQARARFEINKREAEVYERYAAELGMGVDKLKATFLRWNVDVERSNFTSEAKYQAWLLMGNELNDLFAAYYRA